MEQQYRIRNLAICEGESLRKTAAITGHDFETVKKYVLKQNFNEEIRFKLHRQGKLFPYTQIVSQWLIDDLKAPKKQRHTAKRVYDRLKELYPQEFNAGDRAVRLFVAMLRKKIDNQPSGYIPLKHPPGEAQADFGKARFVENGTVFDGYYLSISFPCSNGGFTQLFKAGNQECFLEGLKIIFEHIGKVPKKIWFDNDTVMVTKIKKHGERNLTNGFMRFAMHHKFESAFCNPGKGNEKGSVENKVGYHRRNFFVPVPEFKDLEDYNKKLLEMCNNDMERLHYKKGVTIQELFEQEKESFLPLPLIPFEVFRQEIKKTDKYGKVTFEGKTYSVSPNMAHKQVIVKMGAHKVEIYDENTCLLVKHNRLYGSLTEAMYWPPYLSLIIKRPTALKYTGLFNMLPEILKDYLTKCNYQDKKRSLQFLYDITLKENFEFGIKVFEESLNLGAKDFDSIKATFYRLKNGTLAEISEMNFTTKLPEIKKYTSDLKVYDSLFKAGGQKC